MATPYSWGFRRGEGNYQYQEFLKRRMEAERQADFADRIAAEKERISLEQWQPKADETEVKIKTKADGTSTIVSTEKFPAQSLLDDPMGLEGTGTGDWGLSVTSDQAELDELRRINDLYAMGGQEDVGRVWAMPPVAAEDPLGLGRPQNQWGQVPADIAAEQDRIAYERQFTPTQPGHPLHQYWDGEKFVSTLEEEPVISPEGTPIAGFDMGGLQRFEPHIIPDEAYRQAYGDQERVMGMRGLLEEEIPPVIVPPPTFQTIEPQPQTPMVNRAIEQVDRGTANILPPIDFPPVQPGTVGAEAPFVPAQAITPEQGPLGPPMLAGVSPEMELQAALGEGGARYGQALPMQGLLTDEEILAGAQMPYGDIGVTPLERALMEAQEGPPVVVDTTDIFADIEPEAPPLTSEDIFGGVSPIVPLDPVDPGLRPSNRVETDILKSQAEGYIDPDTGLPPARRPEGVPALKDETAEERRIRIRREVEGLNLSDMDMERLGIPEVAETLSDMYKMQKRTAMVQFANMLKEQQKKKVAKIRGVGRRRQGQQMQLLNPTPLGMGDQYG